MVIDTKNRNIFYPTKTPKKDTKNKRVRYCIICAQNGFPEIPIRWQKCDGKWVLYEINSQINPHVHQICDEHEFWDWDFETIKERRMGFV